MGIIIGSEIILIVVPDIKIILVQLITKDSNSNKRIIRITIIGKIALLTHTIAESENNKNILIITIQ